MCIYVLLSYWRLLESCLLFLGCHIDCTLPTFDVGSYDLTAFSEMDNMNYNAHNRLSSRLTLCLKVSGHGRLSCENQSPDP